MPLGIINIYALIHFLKCFINYRIFQEFPKNVRLVPAPRFCLGSSPRRLNGFWLIHIYTHFALYKPYSLMKPTTTWSRHIHGHETLFLVAEKLHQTIRKSFFLPCSRSCWLSSDCKWRPLGLLLLHPHQQWRHDIGDSLLFIPTVRLVPMFGSYRHYPTYAHIYVRGCGWERERVRESKK